MTIVDSSGRAAPGRLPTIWGDVPPRNPNFTGRAHELDRLHDRLRATRETTAVPHALHGMGGVGKSQLAIEYVHRHCGEFDLVWWFPAEQPGQILSSIATLAQRLGLGVAPGADDTVAAVKEALSTGPDHPNWLLVFDNAESIPDVRSFIPTGGRGEILVTSRNAEWARVATSFRVDVFTRTESSAFLSNRSPDLADVHVDRLAQALGDLPLALEQAASWYAATGMPVDDYLQLLQESRHALELLNQACAPDYPRSVTATFTLLLDRLAEANPAAFQLLQVCSFFSPEPISRELLTGAPRAPIADALDRVLEDPLRFARAIGDIQRSSLATFDHRNDTLRIHRLVQSVLVGSMSEDLRQVMRQGAHTLLATGDPQAPDQRDRWSHYKSLHPHLLASRAFESTDPRVRELVSNLLRFLYYSGDHDGCEHLAQLAHGALLAHESPSDPHALRVAKYLAWIRQVLGRYRQAAELNQQTLDRYLEHYSQDDEGTIDAMSNLASSHRGLGAFTEARDLDERAYAISRQAFGPDDPTTLNAAHSLGVSLRLTSEYARAKELDEQTYRRRCSVHGENSFEALLTLNNLTIDQRESGDYVGARQRQEQCYERYLAAFGERNPATWKAEANLAVARRKAGDHEGARALSVKTHDRFRRRYGDAYPDTIAAAMNLAVDLRHAGELEHAYALTLDAVERFGGTFGEQHPHTWSARANLAIILRRRDDSQAALELNRAALDALTNALGPDHAITLACASNYASDRYSRGDIQRAYELDTDTYQRSERRLGVQHPSTLACAVNLVVDLRALGRDEPADKLHADVLAHYRQVQGNSHPATLNALQSIRADRDIDVMPI